MLADQTLIPSLPAADIERAKAWYYEKLEMKPSVEGPGGEARYEAGNSWFVLYPSQFAGTNQATAASFQVTDIENLVAGLRDRGVEFEDYDLGDLVTVDNIVSLPTGEKAAWFKDSEGNIIGLFQEA